MDNKALKVGIESWYGFGMYRFISSLGTLFVVLGSLFLMIRNSPDNAGIGVFFICGISPYLMGLAQLKGLDDRYHKIVYKATFAGWLFTILFATIALGYQSFLAEVVSLNLGGYRILSGSLIIMVVATVVFSEYYMRKGDAE